MFFSPSMRRSGSTRESLPRVRDVVLTNVEVLNHSLSREVADPEVSDSLPTRVTRQPPPLGIPRLQRALLPPPISRGNTFWRVMIPSTPHPPTTLLAIGDMPLPNFLPLPKGKSNT